MTDVGSILVVVAHPDDEVLGCGGTLAALAAAGHAVHVLILADGERSRNGMSEAAIQRRVRRRELAARRAADRMGVCSVEVLGLPDQRLDSVDLLDIVQAIERSVETTKASMVLTHHAGDVNIDHRCVHDAAVTACRPQPGNPVHTLLFFEVPSSTEWRPPCSAGAFAPNWYVDITAVVEAKMEALSCYGEELRPFPHPRSTEAVMALMKWRGAAVGVPAAEAFELGRYVCRWP